MGFGPLTMGSGKLFLDGGTAGGIMGFGSVDVQAGRTAIIAANAGNPGAGIAASLNMAPGSTLQIGTATDTGTVSWNLDFGASFGGGTQLHVAGGRLNGASSAFGGHVEGFDTVTVDGGAALQFNQTARVRNLQGAGNVSVSSDLRIREGSFSGVIEGTGGITKDISTNTLTLTGANTYNGATTVNLGTLEVAGSGTLGAGGVTINAGGTLSFNRSADFVLANSLSGGGTLEKQGANTMTVTGAHAFSGGTNVNAGTLAVNGSIDSLVTLNGGATLNGTGTVGGISVMSGGTLAPGNSIGTLNVNGPVTFNPGSVFLVEADAAGNSDRIIATGAITINGGTVDVQAGAGTYQRNTTYQILTGASRTGTFTGVTSNLAFLTPSLNYLANGVELLLSSNNISYSEVAGTKNQRAVGNYLDTLAGSPGAVGALITQIDGLSAEQARVAFDSLSGASHASASQVAGATGRSLSGVVMNRAESGGALGGGSAAFHGIQYAKLDLAQTMTDASPAGKAAAGQAGFWGQAIASGGEIASDGNGAGSSYRSAGFLGGYDAMLTGEWLVGGALGYSPTDWDSDANGAAASSGKVKTPLAMAYARWESGPWQVRLNGGYAAPKFETARDVNIGAATSRLSSTHDGQELSAAAEVEYKLQKGRWQVRPLAGVRVASLSEDAFTETGSAGALSVDERRSTNANLSAGARFLLPFASERGGWELRAAYSYLAGDNDTPVSARLAGQPATFTADGTPLKRSALTLGGGLAGQVSRNLTAFADVSYETRGSGQEAYAFTAGARWSW